MSATSAGSGTPAEVGPTRAATAATDAAGPSTDDLGELSALVEGIDEVALEDRPALFEQANEALVDALQDLQEA